MNNNLRTFFLLLSVVPLLIGFQCCKGPSCCDHDKKAEKTTNESVATKNTSHQDSHSKSSGNIITTIKDSETFNTLITHQTIVKFTASWCGACKTIEPLYNDIAQELHTTYQFATVDVDELPDIASKYKIRGIPAFLFFNEGKQLKGHIVGASIDRTGFLKKIDEVFEH